MWKSSVLAAIVLLSATGAATRADSVIFSNIPGTLAPNYVSQGFEATSTSQLGSEIKVAGGANQLLSGASVVLSNWATAANNPGYGDATGYDQALTLNIYNTNLSNPSLAGSLIGSVTQNFHIAWLPVDGVDAIGPYQDVGGIHYHGLAQTVSFDLSAANITVPDDFIYTLAFNTQNYGANPTGVSGPYNSLNFAEVGGDPSVGSYADPDKAFMASTWSGAYSNGAPEGLGVLQVDTGWTGYQTGVSFSAVGGAAVAAPLPASVWSGFALLAGMAAFGIARRARRQTA